MSPTWKSLHPAFRIFAIFQTQAIVSVLHCPLDFEDFIAFECAFLMGDEL